MAPTGASVLTGAIINLVVLIVCLVVFSWLRRARNAYKYYDSKRYTPAVAVKPHEAPSTWFGWIPFTLRYPEADIIKSAGLDTAIYLRLLKYGLQLFIFVSAWVLITVLPTNVTDDEVDHLMSESDDYHFSDFDKLTLSNVKPGSQRMWVHIVSVYVITFVALRMLWQYSKDSVLLRIQFLANSAPSGGARSVLVTDIPGVMEATNKGIKDRAAAGKEAEAARAAAAGEKPKKGLMGLLPGGSATKDTKPEDQRVASTEQVLLQEASSTTGVGDDRDSATGEADALKDLSTVKPVSSAGAAPGTGTSSQGGLRQRRVYQYDLNSTSLDPRVLAERKLEAGATPKELVRGEFEHVYDGQVQDVEVVHDQSGLTKLVAEYDQRKSDVEDFIDACKDKASRDEPLPDPKVLLLFPDAWCKEKFGCGNIGKVPGFPFWRDRLQWLEQQISEQQLIARRLIWPSAFVTFKSRVAQSVSATGLHHHDETTWRTRNAPEPNELLWYNLGMTVDQRSSAQTLMWTLFWLMVFFYMIPVAAVQGLIDAGTHAKSPGLQAFLNNVVVQKLLQAIVPGLALKIFLALVPLILATMMKKAGSISESEVDFGVVSRFYIFQLVVVFVGNVVASSFFSQATALINNPTSIVTVLGTAIPQSATFFITFIFLGIAGLGISFLRIVGLVLMWVFSWLAGGPRVRDRCYQEQYTSCGTSVSGHMMTLFLGIVFCCINPIIASVVCVYFLVASLTEKYNNIFVYRRKYESGGQLWVTLLNQVMAALYIFQLCMIGIISIKKFPYSPIIIPVLLPTIGFHMRVLNLFARPWSIMSLHDAAELDINDKMAEAEQGGSAGGKEEYLSPVFKVQRGDVSSLLAELAEWEPRVAADLQRRAAEKEAQKAAKKGGKQATTPAAEAQV